MEHKELDEYSGLSNSLILLSLKYRKSFRYLFKPVDSYYKIIDTITFIDDELRHEIFLNPKSVNGLTYFAFIATHLTIQN